MSDKPQQPDVRELLRQVPQADPQSAWVQSLEDRIRLRAEKLQQQHRTPWRIGTARWMVGSAAVAACIVFSLIVLLSGPEMSFAAVQQKIRQSRSVTFSTRVQLEVLGSLIELAETQSWIDDTLGVRTDVHLMGKPVVQFVLPLEDQPMLIDHVHHRVTRIALPQSLKTESLLKFDPTMLIRKLGDYVGDIDPIVEPGGEDALEIGFRIDGVSLNLPATSQLELWVSRESKLPTRLTCRIPLSGGQVILWTADRFVWRSPIHPQQILVDIPQDYKQSDTLVVPQPSEKVMIRTLRQYAVLTHGKFPSSEMASWQSLTQVAMLLQQASKNWPTLPSLFQSGDVQRALIGEALASGIYFVQLLDSDADLKYFGDSVRFGDAQRVLMQWELPDGQRRVIYGDLKSETIQP